MKFRVMMPRGRANRERGSILVWLSLMSVLLLVFLAFAFDGGYFYQQKRRMQTGADSAALAAALEKKRNADATWPDMEIIGREDAAKNGFTHGSTNITVDIRPPTSGAYAGVNGYVEGLITQQHRTFFASLFNLLTPGGGNFDETTIRARAVAGPGSSSCIYVLHPSAERAFEIASGSTLNAGCGVQVNSSHSRALSISSSSHLNSTDINIKGNYEATSGSTASPTPDTGETVVPDPLSWLQAPTNSSCNHTDIEVGKNGTETRTLSPGVYCGGIWVVNGSTAILQPGEYIMRGNSNRGGLQIKSGSTIRGNGVFIYNGNLTACSDPDKCKISFESTSVAQLSAMESGYYAGILIFQERVLTGEPKLKISIESGSNSFFHGTLYVPNHQLRYNSYANSSAAAPWTAVVARTLEISSNTTVAVNFNSSSIPSPVRRIALVE
jgi:hypothetical protein